MKTPETVTEAVELLAAQGYADDFRLCATGIAADDMPEPHAVDTAVVDFLFRFEGPSDPGDQAIVLGVSCTEWGRKGVVVSAYGPDADPEEAALLTALARGRA